MGVTSSGGEESDDEADEEGEEVGNETLNTTLTEGMLHSRVPLLKELSEPSKLA